MGFDPYKDDAVKVKHSAPPDSRSPKTLQEVIDRSKIMGIPERGLSPEACQQCGIRTELNPENGKPIAHYFPYCSQEGKLVAFKRVDLLLSKKEDFKYTAIPKSSLTPKAMLFNQTRCNSQAKRLTITEGEYDAASIIEGYLQAGDKKYDAPCVVSIGFGTKNAAQHLSSNMGFVNNYQMKVGCFDNDSATREEAKAGIEKGREAMNQALLLIPDLYDLTFGVDDANHELMKGNIQDFWNRFLWGTKLYEPATILTHSLSFEELTTPLKEGVYIEGLPHTMSMLHGLRPSELTLVIAPSGIGKTTLTKFFSFYTNKAGHHTANIFLEEDAKKTQQSFIAMANATPLPLFRANPSIIPEEGVKRAMEDYLDNGRTAWLRHHYGLGPKALVQQLAILDAMGYRFVFLDHITQVTNKHTGKNKTEQIDILMEQLYEFVESSQMHLVVVSHVARLGFVPPKEKDGGIKYPYWEEFPMEKARGCVDRDTEFLSPAGWKKISNWDEDSVYCIDSTQSGNFMEVGFVDLPCEKLTSIKTSRGMDMALSDEHRVIYSNEKTPDVLREIVLSKALEIHKSQSTGFRGRIPCCFKGNGSLFIDPDRLRVHVMVTADAWRHQGRDYFYLSVKKGRKKERVRLLLDAAKIPYSESNPPSKPGFTIFSFKYKLDKGFPDYWYGLNSECLAVICDEVTRWDGTADGRFSSTSREEADFIQFVYSACGYRSVVALRPNKGFEDYVSQPIYTVSRTAQTHVSFRKAPNSRVSITAFKPEDGRKYCFTTPTGMWLARRNGKIFITGNSGAFEQYSWNIIGLEAERLATRERGRVRTMVHKNREWGTLGIGDVFYQDEQTGLIVPCEAPI